MKKWTAWLLILAMLCTFAPIPKAAADSLVYIPTDAQRIEEEAFAGNTAISEVFISENVSYIGPKAFAGCTGLTEVSLNVEGAIEIAPDAFEDCGDIHFVVYPDTPAELYVLSHGYRCDLAYSGSTFYERIKNLVAEHGGTSALQGDFDSLRLIVRRASNRLPDISAFNPTQIVRRGDVFIIQFENDRDTRDCYGLLYNDWINNGVSGDFVEVDCCVSASFTGDDVWAAGVIDSSGWNTDDPMGFDVYAPYIAENGVGGVTIAVIDSGVEIDPSYSGRLNYGLAMNMVEDEESWSDDRKGHGSYIASVINECVGSANVGILPIRVVGNGSGSRTSGNVDYALLGNAILYAVDCGASIINISMNMQPSAYVEMCINEAIAAGRTVVVSAGNSGEQISSGSFPANLPQVVTVAGISSDFKIMGNYGTTVDYVAPYSLFVTALGVNRGTSFSAPMIASALALVSMDRYHNINDMNATCINGKETGGANSFGLGMPQLSALAKVPVIGLTLDSSMPGELTVGQSIEVKWNVEPSNATDRTVVISIDDESVLSAATDENGGVNLTALKQGVASITVTSNSNPNLSVSRTFTVVQPVASIAIQGASERLASGRTMKLTGVVTPSDATIPEIEWVSSNSSVASVNQYGLVEGKSEGTAAIYARAKDGYGAQSPAVTIAVVPIPDAEGLTLTVNGENVTNGDLSMAPGEIATIVTQIYPEDAVQDVSFEIFGNYITVSDTGVIVAQNPGTAYVRVSSKDNRNVYATLEVHVRILPTSVGITGETVIDEGGSTILTATVLPENADNRTVSWSSSDSSVATVSSSGSVNGVKSGTAVIIATANGDSTVTQQVIVTVRHPIDLEFDLNKPDHPDQPGQDLNGSLSSSNMRIYSGYPVGTLPTAQCDYFYFLGWFTEPSGGTHITDVSVIDSEETGMKLYAQWQLHEESDWVLTSAVPSNATVTKTGYSYRESTESTSSSMAGWISNGNYWKQTGSGSKQYASFPSTYNTSHWTYTSLNGSAYSAYEYEATKRTVSNTHSGYVYWHWAYNAAYYNNTSRWISDRNQVAGASRNLTNYSYCYFFAFTSTTNAPKLSDFTYTWGADAKYNSSAVTYNCASCLPSGADKSATSGLNNPRFLRLDYYTSSYTDYQKIYKYYRDLNYQTNDPGTGSNISNKVTYVKYRVK